MQFSAIHDRFPTATVVRICERAGLELMFKPRTGGSNWKDAIREFQKLIIGGVSSADAKELIYEFLPYDQQNAEDQNDKAIEELDPLLDRIAGMTKNEASSLIIDELVGMTIAAPQSKYWIDGKTKMEAVKMFKSIVDGEKHDAAETRGLVLRLAGVES